MAEEIQEAVQIIRVAYDGIEIAMKVGSGGIAAMQKAIDFLKGIENVIVDDLTKGSYGAERAYAYYRKIIKPNN